ncbi:hypothetical protein BG000_000082 [Podila horticola]|nr:hypothetical protein BG000_000082 [Podila horticola]
MAPTLLASPIPNTTSTYTSHDPTVDASAPVHEIPVLIVGAGPVGLLEAVLLTKMGIRGTHARTLEILAMIEDGFIDKFLAQRKPLKEAHIYYGSRPMRTLLFSRSDTSRYEQPLFMEQRRLSEVLAKCLSHI